MRENIDIYTTELGGQQQAEKAIILQSPYINEPEEKVDENYHELCRGEKLTVSASFI